MVGPKSIFPTSPTTAARRDNDITLEPRPTSRDVLKVALTISKYTDRNLTDVKLGMKLAYLVSSGNLRICVEKVRLVLY